MIPGKRLFDILLAICLSVPVVPIIALVALVILLTDGRPVFFVSERMRTPRHPFMLLKFRTMHVVERDAGVSGGDKAHRITPVGHILRRLRVDELPQLWNVLCGDLSFVGPRPPLRRYVEMCPELYSEVLKQRPGITGLATLVYHRTEEKLLAACRTAEETENVYVRRCVPRKAELDLIYARRRTMCLDLRLMAATLFRRFSPGRAACRQPSP